MQHLTGWLSFAYLYIPIRIASSSTNRAVQCVSMWRLWQRHTRARIQQITCSVNTIVVLLMARYKWLTFSTAELYCDACTVHRALPLCTIHCYTIALLNVSHIELLTRKHNKFACAAAKCGHSSGVSEVLELSVFTIHFDADGVHIKPLANVFTRGKTCGIFTFNLAEKAIEMHQVIWLLRRLVRYTGDTAQY